MTTRRAWRLLLAISAVAMAGCSKSEPPPDPLKAQRAMIEKAKNVEGVVGGAAAETRKKIDDEETK